MSTGLTAGVRAGSIQKDDLVYFHQTQKMVTKLMKDYYVEKP